MARRVKLQETCRLKKAIQDQTAAIYMIFILLSTIHCKRYSARRLKTCKIINEWRSKTRNCLAHSHISQRPFTTPSSLTIPLVCYWANPAPSTSSILPALACYFSSSAIATFVLIHVCEISPFTLFLQCFSKISNRSKQ